MTDNRIVHFEIPADEPGKLQEFYSGLFGWTFQKIPVPGLEFWRCAGPDGPGIDVAVMQRQNATQPWMNYVGVANVDAAIEKAVALGGQVALPKMPIPGGRSLAVIADPQGNMFGLLEQPHG
ncbi:MAG: lactoylglutathione lyase family protein [Gemmataceae bacterium]|nr:lactoylglutathione lyase family protein [Gemmataceae bacterium]